MMKIEEGKSYLDQHGHKWVNPRRDSGVVGEPWRLTTEYGGTMLFDVDGRNSVVTLISEAPSEPAPTGPVVVEPRKRIVPGAYGRLVIGDRDHEFMPISLELVGRLWPAADIRTLIAQLAEIADALDEGAR